MAGLDALGAGRAIQAADALAEEGMESFDNAIDLAENGDSTNLMTLLVVEGDLAKADIVTKAASNLISDYKSIGEGVINKI